MSGCESFRISFREKNHQDPGVREGTKDEEINIHLTPPVFKLVIIRNAVMIYTLNPNRIEHKRHWQCQQ
jgi:hypothetical protein